MFACDAKIIFIYIIKGMTVPLSVSLSVSLAVSLPYYIAVCISVFAVSLSVSLAVSLAVSLSGGDRQPSAFGWAGWAVQLALSFGMRMLGTFLEFRSLGIFRKRQIPKLDAVVSLIANRESFV